MSQLPRISDAEWTVMKVLWNRSPLSATEIISELEQAEKWHPKTVKTLLNRLVKKGALGFRRDGKAYLYRPLVAESDCAGAASDAFLSRVFGGSLKPMLAHFMEKKRLSGDELKELKRLLEDK
jgi:BlaI family penicillinase repressor